MVKLSGSFLKIQKEENKIKKLDEVFDYVHYDYLVHFWKYKKKKIR